VPLHRDGRRAWISVGDVLAEFPVALVAQGINSATP
jgi:hypothetical protein